MHRCGVLLSDMWRADDLQGTTFIEPWHYLDFCPPTATANGTVIELIPLVNLQISRHSPRGSNTEAAASRGIVEKLLPLEQPTHRSSLMCIRICFAL